MNKAAHTCATTKHRNSCALWLDHGVGLRVASNLTVTVADIIKTHGRCCEVLRMLVLIFPDSSGTITPWPIRGLQSVDITFSGRLEPWLNGY